MPERKWLYNPPHTAAVIRSVALCPVVVLSPVLSVDTVLLAVGVFLLWKGAELLVSGAGRIAVGFGLRRATVGVTVVALGTTAPELLVSTLGALTATTDIGLGTVVGSNIANIGLVIGLAALFRPMGVSESSFKYHTPFLVLATVLLVGLGWDGEVSRLDGVIMLTVLAGFTYYLIRRVRTGVAFDEASDRDEETTPRDWAAVVGGLVLLFVGSRWMVMGGRGILSSLGFSDIFIGLTVLAIGTSLPELAASLLAAVREQAGFSVGNVVGSNIYNILAVVGVLAVLTPVEVSGGVLSFEFPVLVLFTAVFVAAMWWRRRLTRLDGAALLLGYILFVYLLIP